MGAPRGIEEETESETNPGSGQQEKEESGSAPGKAAPAHILWDPSEYQCPRSLREKMDASEEASYKPFSAGNMLASAQVLCPSLYQALPAQSANLLAVAWAEFLFHF